jgi:type VI protein secretion system component Hcp
MKKITSKTIAISVLLAAVLLASTTISSAYAQPYPHGFFMQIDGITWGTGDINHPGWIDVSSYSFGGSVENNGKSINENYNLFSFIHGDDGASLSLEGALVAGKTIQHASFQDCFIGITPAVCFAQFNFTNLKITSAKIRGGTAYASSSDGTPEQEVTLESCKVDMTWQPLLPNGQKNGPPTTYSEDLCTAK